MDNPDKTLKLYKCPNCNLWHWMRNQIFLDMDLGKIVCTECQANEIIETRNEEK
jgi:hypothetical protein